MEGEVAKPRTFTMDEILKLAPLEERIYRHRCVEAWSIVVPWIGYSFSALAKLVEPTPSAKYVAFQTYYDKKADAAWRDAGIQLPYVEGLRLDEAMNPADLLCVGMYGETLPNQDGAPVRMVIPWKYGFKSIKSIVKIRFVKGSAADDLEHRPAPSEYGFYSNVNPTVDHPRWSQANGASPGADGLFDRPDSHADVQRLRRSGGKHVHRHGPAQKLLLNSKAAHVSKPSSQASGPRLLCLFFALCRWQS